MEIKATEQASGFSGRDAKEGHGGINRLEEDACGADEDDMDMVR